MKSFGVRYIRFVATDTRHRLQNFIPFSTVIGSSVMHHKLFKTKFFQPKFP